MSPAILRLLQGLLVASTLLVAGCTGQQSSTSGTALYVFDASDSASNRLLVWDDLETLFANPSASPTRELSGALLDKVQTLGWGGLCADPANNRLYLVSTTGYVVRISEASSLSGSVTSAADIVSFHLGTSTDRLSGGSFGQATLDPYTGSLYVTESSDSDARIWVVTSPASCAEGEDTPVQTLAVTGGGDSGGTGLTAGAGGGLYAYFQDGDTVTTTSGDTYTGPRLRYGTASGFAAHANVVIGTNAGLGEYGALAYDASNNKLYVARHDTDAGMTGAPIEAFAAGQFSTGAGASPEATLGSTADQPNLRILAHGRTKDWLAAAGSTGTTPGYRIWLWKAPASGTEDIQTVDLGSTVQIRGLAVVAAD